MLTERLIRLEYQEDGIFEDRLTELVTNRSFPIPKFQFKEDAVSLEITTKYFHLFYLALRISSIIIIKIMFKTNI